jgi:hypothetical protein
LNENELRNFLRWTTGLSALSLNRQNEKKIKIIKSNRFFAHTCITVLSLELNTNVQNEKEFKQGLKKSIENGYSSAMNE